MALRNRVSIAVARFIPGFIFLCAAYASYVVLGPLAIQYLIDPPADLERPRRVGAAIAVLSVYFTLLFPVAICWLRLLLTVLLDPGYIPLGRDDQPSPSLTEPQPGLEQFWTRDVFVCDPNGLPIWCRHCHNWKPDRTHHNQDVGRCTRKMDHFCPWVGGVVGERSMKFFVQFLFYTMIFTTYITALFGFFVAEYKGNAHWFVALGLGGFFLLFTTGMMLNSLNMVFQNVTTIESVREKMYLAVILPPEAQLDPLMPPPPARTSRGSVDGASDMDSQRPLTSDLDDPCHQNYFAQQSRPMERQMSLTKKLLKGTITYPLQLPTDRPPIPAPAPRTFAIIEAPRGINPWSLGEVFLNFKAVFGNRPLDWFLPLKHSPCCDHSSQISEYPLGPEFEVLLDDAGLTRSAIISWPTGRRRASTTSPSRKRIRRLDNGWKNGERPDGWVSEKEARRIRKEWRLRRRERRRVENTKAWGR